MGTSPHAPSASAVEWVALGTVAKPHGVRGELHLKMYNTESKALLEVEEVLVRFPNGDAHEVSVDHARQADQSVLMKLYSVDDRDRAEELRGAEICVKRSELPTPEEGEFYVHDVMGASVYLASSPSELFGKVLDFRSYPSVSVLVVGTEAGHYEVPLLPIYVDEINVAAKEVCLSSIDELELMGPRGPKKEKTPKPAKYKKKAIEASQKASSKMPKASSGTG